MRPKGIRVLVACPGVIKTSFRKRASGNSDVKSGLNAMDVNYAVDQLWNQIAKGRGIHYFDFKTRLMVGLARFVIPRSIISKILFKTVLSYKKKAE